MGFTIVFGQYDGDEVNHAEEPGWSWDKTSNSDTLLQYDGWAMVAMSYDFADEYWKHAKDLWTLMRGHDNWNDADPTNVPLTQHMEDLIQALKTPHPDFDMYIRNALALAKKVMPN